ncbi:peptidoglycan DD-metalloendopeptidase family protein [Rhabdochromatium marinum]|uniref:peptidoglycan DD-metalloendopeptidase family protein n=1 Tax=Rhabdochromatium marinum TaxID=48729 RepID=UPI0019030AF2
MTSGFQDPTAASQAKNPKIIERPLSPNLNQETRTPDASPSRQAERQGSQALAIPLNISHPLQGAHPQRLSQFKQRPSTTNALYDPLGIDPLRLPDLPELSTANPASFVLQLNAPTTTLAAIKPPPTLSRGPFRLDYQVQAGDTLGTILQSQGLPSDMVYQILGGLSDQQRQRLTRIRPGETIQLNLDETLQLSSLKLKLNATKRLLVYRANDHISAKVEAVATEPRRQCLTAVVKNSLYNAAKNAGIPDQVTQGAINLFRHQINFARQTRKGDQISVLFEQIYADDQPIKTGPVLAVEITNGNKQYAAVRYTTSKGITDYYSTDGQPLNKSKYSFLRRPLKYTRISSRFSNSRRHPILGRVRPHTGVDFAAPSGRRVVAAADGRVHFRGLKSGYGNLVILRHGSRYETRYAHLMRFATGLSQGSQVKRGQTVGYVGQTGLATGPHLHYEIRINGTPVNPLTAKLPFLNEFDDSEKARFRRETKPLLVELQRNKNQSLLVDARGFDQTDDRLPAPNGETLQ